MFGQIAHGDSHSHVFGQDQVRDGEQRTKIVIAITALMMIAEIAAGILFGSMALLADGLHMASHTAALLITWLAYVLARRYSGDRRFSFGTGKTNSLAAFASAILLAGFASVMAWKSGVRLFHPVTITFDAAIAVAVAGLVVNAVCALILSGKSVQHEHHDHVHKHKHDHDHDQNLRSAYLHVLADAVTSLTAIAALLTGKFLGWNWMDPIMGIVGAILVASWSWGLLRDSGKVLLDWQASKSTLDEVKFTLEAQADCRITDLHIWSIGPGIYSAAISAVTTQALAIDTIKRRLPSKLGIVHVTVELTHEN